MRIKSVGITAAVREEVGLGGKRSVIEMPTHLKIRKC